MRHSAARLPDKVQSGRAKSVRVPHRNDEMTGRGVKAFCFHNVGQLAAGQNCEVHKWLANNDFSI